MKQFLPIYIAILCIITVMIAISLQEKKWSEMPPGSKRSLVIVLSVGVIVIIAGVLIL